MNPTTHKFNQQLGRLEPTATLCQYCKKAHSETMSDNYFCPVFKEQDRTNIVVYRSVKFNKLHIGIPRCKDCAAIHESSSLNAWLISLALIALAAFLFYSIWGIYVIFFLVFGGAIGLVGGPILFTNLLVHNKNILTKKEGAKQDRLVQEMVNSGWSLTQPSA